jgi:hypothetical protein
MVSTILAFSSQLPIESLILRIGACNDRQHDCFRLRAGIRVMGDHVDVGLMVDRRSHFCGLLHVLAFCHVRHFSLFFLQSHALRQPSAAIPSQRSSTY